MMKLCPLLFLIGLNSALGEASFLEFIKDTCNFTYGEPVGQIEGINDMQCVKSCIKHEKCNSLMYETATGQCYLNAETQQDGDQFPLDCGMKYAELVERYFGCDEGWLYLAGKCYLYVDQLLTWHGCDNFCILEKSYLAKLYDASTYPVLYDVTQTGWSIAVKSLNYPPWITVNDLRQEGIIADRDGVPINPDLTSTVQTQSADNDCGVAHSDHVHMSSCSLMKSCICEKDPRTITKRPSRFN